MILDYKGVAHLSEKMNIADNEEIFDLRALIAEASVQLGHKANALGLILDVSVAPEMPRHFKGNPLNIQEIIFHLAEHGLQSMVTGCQTMRFDAFSLDGLGRYKILIEITNAGFGIPADKQLTLFQPPQDADRHDPHCSFQKVLIANKLAKKMDGIVSLHSVSGWGVRYLTEFKLTVAKCAHLNQQETVRAAS